MKTKKQSRKRFMAAFALAWLLALIPVKSVNAEGGSVYNFVDEAKDSGVHGVADEAEEPLLPERIAQAIKAGKRNVDIVTGNVMEVPSSVLKDLSGNKVTLAMHTGDGIAVSLTGTDVRKIDKPFQIVLTGDDTLPEAARQQVLDGAVASREFGMMDKAAFPFRVNVHLNLGAENAGKPAVLYYYEEADEQMKPVGIFKVSESGYAMFALNRGDEYIAVVMDGNAYTVTQGDTLGGIAGKSRIKLSRLLAQNPLIKNADRIYPGQVIVIP